MTGRSNGDAQGRAPARALFPAIPPADVLGRLAALQSLPTVDFERQWRELFATERRPSNGPTCRAGWPTRPGARLWRAEAETRARLEALGEQLDGGNVVLRRIAPTAADRRHPAGPGAWGRGARRHGAGGRLRVGGPALPVALRHRPRHHRHPLERLDLLRAAPARWRMSRREKGMAALPGCRRK